jgi:hypothetical protein
MGRETLRALRAAPGGALLLVCGCGIWGGLVGTEIKIEGGQRTLEEQVLGAFDHLGDEVYVLAGVRAIDPVTGAPTAPPPMTRSEARALDARRRMEFNRDDVREFLRLAYVGEGNDGFLVIFEDELQDLRASDPRRSSLVEAVVAEENEDRLLIMQRIVDTNPGLTGEEGLRQVGRILAARHRQDAEPGMKVQLPSGAWAARQGDA